jgi:hypothetical protein
MVMTDEGHEQRHNKTTELPVQWCGVVTTDGGVKGVLSKDPRLDDGGREDELR